MNRHDAYFEFSAETHYDLGWRMGAAFAGRAHEAIAYWSSLPDWRDRVARASSMLAPAREHFPDLVAELKGYCAGAGVPFDALWSVSVESDADDPAGSSERCTTLVTNGGALVAHNEDFDPSSDSVVAIVRRSVAGRTMLDLFYYNTLGGNGASASSAGYVHCVNSLSQSDRVVGGVPRNVIARWLATAGDPEAAFARLERLPRASGFSHTLVGARGDVYGIEWSSSRASMERPALPFVHANNYIGPLAGLDCNDNGTGSRERYEAARRAARDGMSEEDLMEAFGDGSAGPRVSLLNERTVARVLFNLERKVASIWLRSEAEKGWLEYPLDFM